MPTSFWPKYNFANESNIVHYFSKDEEAYNQWVYLMTLIKDQTTSALGVMNVYIVKM